MIYFSGHFIQGNQCFIITNDWKKAFIQFKVWSKSFFCHYHCIYVAFIHHIHNHILQFYQLKNPLLLFLTFDNFILTFYLHSLSGKLSFVVFEASLQIICLFLSSEIILFVLLPHFYLNFYQELSDCYIHSKLCLLYHYYPLELMIP